MKTCRRLYSKTPIPNYGSWGFGIPHNYGLNLPRGKRFVELSVSGSLNNMNK